MDDYYSPWEWQPVERLPWGCVEVIVRYEDGSTSEMCSCDYWWSYAYKAKEVADFRYL